MGASSQIQLHNTVRRLPEQLSNEIDDDLVILSVERGRYYGTGIVGKRIWSLVAEPIQVLTICDTLLEEFDVERSVCEQEVFSFLAHLEQEGLIKVE